MVLQPHPYPSAESKTIEGVKWMRRIGLLLWNLPEIIGSLLLLAITAIIGAAVTSRYLFFFTFTWAEELVRFLFIWLAFIGGALAVKHLTHFRLVLLRNALPDKVRTGLDALAHLCFIVLGGILLFVGFDLVSRTMEQLSPALYLPQGIVYFSMPLSGAMIIVYSSVHLYQDLFGGKRSYESTTETNVA